MVTGQLELTWLASCSASALRTAAHVAADDEAVDSQLRAAMFDASRGLADELQTLPGSAEQLWRHLLPLSAGVENNRELADVVLRKTCGLKQAASHRERLAERIAEVERAFVGQFPNCADDLVLRGRPLREQWEARGPGLLQRLVSLTEPQLLVERADVVLVQPITAGGGESHLVYNAVHIEGVLANPVPEIPEVVRLAWLLAQLHLDLPRFSEHVNSARLSQIAGLALVPPILQAAEHVELATYNEASVQRAISHWMSPAAWSSCGTTLLDWWYTYEESRPAFSIALRGLEKMLEQ